MVFAIKGDVDACAGNQPMEDQIQQLEAYLRLAPAKVGAPSLAVFESALGEVLPPFLHNRLEIPIRHAGLAGRSIQLQKTALPFVAEAKAPRAAIEITSAVSSGPFHLIAGRYDTEGIRFHALLMTTDKGFETLYRVVVEH